MTGEGNRAGQAYVTTTRRSHEWRTKAACLGADPDTFESRTAAENNNQAAFLARIGRALADCRRCPVTAFCRLERRGAGGVWGGRYYPDKWQRGTPAADRPQVVDAASTVAESAVVDASVVPTEAEIRSYAASLAAALDSPERAS